MSTGAVYDRGYRPFDGELGGQDAARWALLRASVRRALGMRRSWRQKLFPWLLLVIVSIPAIVNVGIAYLTRDAAIDERVEFITYREYVGVSTALLLFIGLTAPDIVCPDRRNRTLPLLFARPLTGIDYVVAKVGAIAVIVFAFGMIPQTVLFVGQTFVAKSSMEYFTDNADVLWKVPIAVAILALYYASFSVAVSAFATRRIVAAASMLVILLVFSIIAGVAGNPGDVENPDSSAWVVVNLLAAPLYVRDLVFAGEIVDTQLAGVDNGALMAVGVYVSVVAASLGSLVWRYRWVEA